MKFEDLDLSGLDEPQEIAHDFEIDLHHVVVANHGFTMEAIEKSESEELSKIQEGLAHEDCETVYSVTGPITRFYEDLRQAAHTLALVAVVTRFQSWIGRFVKQLKIATNRSTSSMLTSQLEALNAKLGVGPVPVLFFEDLVAVRDSIIHNDSEAEWEFPKGTARSH